MPRIPPVEPPYDDETATMLAKWMPPGAEAEPLKLFRTLAVHNELASRMRPLGAGLLGKPSIDPREREIVIHRTCALSGAEYEWGVHAVAFGRPLGFTDDELRATVDGNDGGAFTGRDALLMRLCDELHETATVSDELWAELEGEWPKAQLLELVTLNGWYRLLSQVINAAGVEREEWALRFADVTG